MSVRWTDPSLAQLDELCKRGVRDPRAVLEAEAKAESGPSSRGRRRKYRTWDEKVADGQVWMRQRTKKLKEACDAK